MTSPREPFERLFERFNDAFAETAKREGFIFDPKSGPNISRALRVKEGNVTKCVFLEMRDHWIHSDPADPQVILTYGVWLYPQGGGFPFYLLTRVLYEGTLSQLKDIEAKLRIAASEVKRVSEDLVVRDGKLFVQSLGSGAGDAGKARA